MNEQMITTLIAAMGFVDQHKRGIDGDERFRHKSRLQSAGSIYIMDDRMTATGPYQEILASLEPSNGLCNSKRYPAWSGDALARLLTQMPGRFKS